MFLKMHEVASIWDERKEYLQPVSLFYHIKNEIPNSKVLTGLNNDAVFNWLSNNCKEEIERVYYKDIIRHNGLKMFHYCSVFVMKNGLFINVGFEKTEILFTADQEEDAEYWVKIFGKYRTREKKPSAISLVTSSFDGLGTTDVELRKPKLNLHLNYADDLVSQHDEIVKRLRAKNSSGLFLFHGEPGTGKSTYIRYLIHLLKKKVVFIPPRLAAEMDSPTMNKLLIENANSVFVIEDAEELILARNLNTNAGISFLLNLTDGLLGESLGIQCIATFNTHISKIDPALLRKGRLINMYEFRPLSVVKSRELLSHLNMPDFKVTGPMTLAEIYNAHILNQPAIIEKNVIGFQTNKAVLV